MNRSVETKTTENGAFSNQTQPQYDLVLFRIIPQYFAVTKTTFIDFDYDILNNVDYKEDAGRCCVVDVHQSYAQQQFNSLLIT